MKNSEVVIIDYGMGNLLSVSRAFEHFGAKVTLAQNPEDIDRAERLVLPGVGAFRDGMFELERRGFVDALKKYCREGRSLLGICLGMQMLMDESEEFGVFRGLGLVPGKVVAIPSKTTEDKPLKIPHIGWNRLRAVGSSEVWKGTILEDLVVEPYAYFVHSFRVMLLQPENCLADAEYGGHSICAVLRSGALYGCQFHPEKSGPVGLKIIENFLRFSNRANEIKS